jgi:nicotinamide mononucleotide transporter
VSLGEVLAPLQQPLVTIIGTPVSWTEVLGFGSGALCVWLVARQHIANWPIGIANNLFFILLFTGSGLYADAGLQLVFIALACYGWWTWAHGGGPGSDDLPVARTGRTEWVWLGAAGFAGTLALTVLLDRFSDSTVPFWDALTTALSLMATYGQCRKLLESWWLWIAADVVYIPLYAYKDLYLTSLLYVGFLALCIVGLVGWRRELAGRSGVREAGAEAVS